MFNFAGNSNPLNHANQMSLHSTNPGTGTSPAGGSEISGSPYARQACSFGSPVANGTAAESLLASNVTFNLALEGTINAEFIGLWNGSTYLGYIVPNEAGNYSGTATTRQFIVNATATKLIRDNLP